MSEYIDGVLTMSDEKPGERRHFQLKEHTLRSGSALEVQISGHWIAGTAEFGTGFNWHGWYLATVASDDPVLLLRTGLKARIDKEWT
jgi:hypothetical protein